MFIEPSYRSQGIGTQLIDEFKNWAKQHDTNRLRVVASAQNKAAIRFYRRNGFEDYSVTLEGDI